MTDGTYIGLDQSLANTGWSIARVSNNRVHIIKHGVFKTTPLMNEQERLSYIEDRTRELILKYNPSKCFTEGVFLDRRKPHQGKVLVKVQTTIHNLLHNNNVDFEVISSKTWRKRLNIHRSKEGKSGTTSNLLVRGITEHSADSIAILLVGLLEEETVGKDSINEFIKSN